MRLLRNPILLRAIQRKQGIDRNLILHTGDQPGVETMSYARWQADNPRNPKLHPRAGDPTYLAGPGYDIEARRIYYYGDWNDTGDGCFVTPEQLLDILIRHDKDWLGWL